MKEVIKKITYGALAAATKNKGIARNIGGEKIRFPARYWRYYSDNYEPDLFKFLRHYCQSGDTFLDCGAHFGLFSVVASRLVGKDGKVISFEPTPIIRKTLEEVIKINNCQNVEVRAEAVSQKAGTATFFDTGDEGSNANSLVQLGKHTEGLTVKTNSLDNITSDRNLNIKCIKIDVEGAELDVLIGSEKIIKKYRPAIFLSLHPEAIEK